MSFYTHDYCQSNFTLVPLCGGRNCMFAHFLANNYCVRAYFNIMGHVKLLLLSFLHIKYRNTYLFWAKRLWVQLTLIVPSIFNFKKTDSCMSHEKMVRYKGIQERQKTKNNLQLVEIMFHLAQQRCLFL